MVSLQVSRGRSPRSNPGLNIIGCVQPRGPRAVVMFEADIICLLRGGMDIAIDVWIVGDVEVASIGGISIPVGNFDCDDSRRLEADE